MWLVYTIYLPYIYHRNQPFMARVFFPIPTYSSQKGPVGLVGPVPVFFFVAEERSIFGLTSRRPIGLCNSHLANGTLKKSLNSIFPTKYVIPKSLKFSHWPSKFFFVWKCFEGLKQVTYSHLKDPETQKKLERISHFPTKYVIPIKV